MTPLVDIGANLAHSSFDHDRPDLIRRAAAAGVSRIVVTGSTVECSRAALHLAQQRPAVLFATAGVHPHHATEFGTQTAPELVELATHAEVVAIGECGLDYYREISPRPAQRLAFERQLALASIVGKPVFLHQREAHEDFLAILREHISGLAGAVAHCFTGTREQMDAYLEMGLYIGITGWICDERRGDSLRTAVAGLPLERVMIETDAPYLLPRMPGNKSVRRRNEPAFLPVVLGEAARCMGVDALALAEFTTRNAERFFRLPAPRDASGKG